MRQSLLTNNFFCSLLYLALLSFNGAVFAQVYKSYDAEGNVVFSDVPARDSKEVEVSEPNVSDSLEIPPAPPAESAPEGKLEADSELEPEPATQPDAESDSADTNNDGRISRREKEAQREARRKKRREAAKAAEEE